MKQTGLKGMRSGISIVSDRAGNAIFGPPAIRGFGGGGNFFIIRKETPGLG